jgi:DNA-binding Lrp family transcriptional regulator
MGGTWQGSRDFEVAASPTGRASLLSAAFVVDQANLSRGGGDLLDPLVFAAIVQANLAPLRSDPEVQRRYANSGETLPDDLRRPISVHAVAQSLRLPYETVRRKIRRLVDRGLCVATGAGVVIPAAVIAGQDHAAVQAARLERLNRFHDELVRAGVLAPDDALAGPVPAGLMRAANTALSQYLLRTTDRLVALAGGVVDGFVLLGLAAANARYLVGREAAAHPTGLAAEPRPCSGLALSRRLGMPNETLRRRLPILREAGFAQHVRGGWIVAVPPAQRPRIAQLAAENEADLHRLFARLKELAEAAA